MIHKEEGESIDSFNDRLDILRHVSEIKLRLKKDITNDFVLAKLPTEDKNAIVEMTSNAYFSKRLLDELKNKSTKWVWNNEKSIYEKVEISKEDKKRIEDLAKAMFDSYMVKIYMTVVLNRNVDQNYLINVLSGYVDKDMPKSDISDASMKNILSELTKENKRDEK